MILGQRPPRAGRYREWGRQEKTKGGTGSEKSGRIEWMITDTENKVVKRAANGL